MRSLLPRPARSARALAIVAVLASILAPRAGAQSITAGALRGVVLSAGGGGEPIAGVQVTVDGADGRTVALLESGFTGEFVVPLLAPGVYRILAEQVGLQPVRLLGVTVVAGQTTAVTFRLEAKPPPITEVVELRQPGAIGGTGLGRTLSGRWLRDGDRYRGASDLSRGVTEVDGPRDARSGFALSAGGLGVDGTRLIVDGFAESLLRHPGVPDEPGEAPLFQRDALQQAQLLGVGLDTEWRGFPGVILNGQTARGTNTLSFRPYATFTGSQLADRTEDNPTDSTANSFQVGAELSGAVVPDTAHFLLRFDYQDLRIPAARPWESDLARFDGADVSLTQTLTAIAADSFGTQLGGAAVPVVHRWKGLSTLGRLDWQINRTNVMLRAGYADWEEKQPFLGEERSNLSRAQLDARDFTGALTLTTVWDRVANEFRFGGTNSRRDWTAPSLPATALVAEGAAFGGSGTLPARFDQTTIDVSDAVQIAAGLHRFKLGLDVAHNDYEQNYRYGGSGLFTFGSLDEFGRAEGTFFQAVGPSGERADPQITDFGLFLQDTWSVSPELQVLGGLRFDTQYLPSNDIQLNPKWQTLTGQRNDIVPEDRKGAQPRGGFVWNVQNRGEWIVRGGAGLFVGRVEPAAVSEAILFDGGTTIRRGLGTFTGWPRTPDAQLAPDVGPRLTLFNDSYRKPRAFKTSLGITRAFPVGVSLHLTGAYHHTDYLLRRTDLNRVPAAVATTQDGRPVFGQLVKQGGLLTAAPKSNRRFDDFDLVSGLAPTGFSDYYELSALIERAVPVGLSLAASYTYSQTDDDVLGARSPDPADQLNPFPEGLAGSDWADARSDFDVPHRVVLSGEYRAGGRTPVTLGARFRWRSGLPFTPGFRPGVDANGDGAGNNDPAFLDDALDGLTAALRNSRCDASLNINAFAARNSCREDGVYNLDLRLSIGLPVNAGLGNTLALTVDAFNVAGKATGLVDRALVLVDPDRPLVTGAGGQVTVPLLVNPRFGSLLSRRTDPRLIRVGFRMEY